MKVIEFETKVENGMISIPKQYKFSNPNVKIAIFDENANHEVLHIEIDDQLKHYFTVSTIKNYLEKQLQFLLMEQIKSTIDHKISESGVDNDLLLKTAREQAWDGYKDYFLKGVIST